MPMINDIRLIVYMSNVININWFKVSLGMCAATGYSGANAAYAFFASFV